MRAADLAVTEISAGRWRVEVRSAPRTSHEVTIPASYLDKLGVAAAPPERVLEESFRFLLEREPNTSILSRFELPEIARYFPEFEKEIARRLA